jgi:photosystem II stability/assembly factor-like uncharacterized protein
MFKSHWILLLSCLSLAAPAALTAQMPATQLTGALRWRSVGPFTGGRVTSVAGVASEPNLFYQGTAGGGVWETTDYGYTWRNISDKYFKTGAIGAIAVAPSNPKILYVGTGDSAPRNTELTGHGMYKSTDGGKTWSYIGLGATHIISWIVIDPNNPDTVYAAAFGHLWAPNADRGVYKTTDGGRTWNKVLFVNDNTGAITLAMDPANPQVVYATMWQMYRRHWTFSSGGPGSGIYKTTDGGAHWTNISHRPGLPTGIFGKVGIAVAPSEPNVVYALIQADYKGQAGGLFRSDDGGQNWRLINNSMNITQRAFYYGYVYVNPKDPNTIYLPNVGVYISHDAGKKLIPLRPPHGDNHVFWINPNNPQIFIEGNDGGATVTLNGGHTFSSENNQPTGQFYHANLDNQFPFHIYGAQQDRGSNDGSSAAPAAVWKTVTGGEMSWDVPTPGRPWITYGSGYYSQEMRENRRTGLTTNVSPWPEYKFGLAGDHIKYRYGWNHHAIVFAARNPNELLMGANVLFETLDQGQHWKAISPDLTRNDKSKQLRPGGPISADVTGEEMFDTISSIAVSPLTDNEIWTGSDDGLVYLTRDAGAHWTPVRPPALPTWSTITCIELSQTDAGTAYVSASRYDWDDFHPYIYKTTDYGKTWTAMTAGLPQNQYVESVRLDPNDPSLMFAGTSASVFFSLDGGANWEPLKLNLPAVRVNDVEIQPQQRAVVLATFGRGFWVLDNLQFLEQLGSARVASDAAYVFQPQQAWLGAGGRGGFGFGARGGQPRPAGVTVFYHLPSDYSAGTPVKLIFSDANGNVVNSVSLPEKPMPNPFGFGGPRRAPKLHPGMNSFQWNMRYPTAIEVKGIFNTGFSASVPLGPQVVPGTYDVALSYNGRTTAKRPFTVKLDPRWHTTQAELEQQFQLLMRLHRAVNGLDVALNRAIDARNALEKAAAANTSDPQSPELVKLNRDIDRYVDLRIQSGEGALVYPPRLRSWLSAITNQVGQAPVAPTVAMVQVADGYIAQAKAAVTRLQADVTASAATNR